MDSEEDNAAERWRQSTVADSRETPLVHCPIWSKSLSSDTATEFPHRAGTRYCAAYHLGGQNHCKLFWGFCVALTLPTD